MEVLGYNGVLKKGDLMMFDGQKFIPISKSSFDKQINEIKQENAELKQVIEKLKTDVNSALAQYHKALQELAKGE